MRCRVLLLLLLLLLPSCRSESKTALILPFDSVFTATPIVVEENRQDLVVAPRIRFDGHGFLYTDYTEGRVRRYDSTGRIEWSVGGKGEGPGEYDNPSDIARLPDGRILVFEFNGRVTVLTEDGQEVLATRPPRFQWLEDVAVLNDSLLLVNGKIPDATDGSTLHIWNWRADSVVSSFFTPFEATPYTDAVRLANWVKFDVRGDTIAAIHPVADSVFFLSLDGEQIGSVPLQIQGYTAPTNAPLAAASDVRVRRDWFSTFDLISDVAWLSTGELLVAYRRQRLDGLRWSLVVVEPDRGRVRQMPNAGRLVSAGMDDRVLFIDPSSEVPNRWLLAELR